MKRFSVYMVASLCLSACSSSQLKVDNELVEKLPVAQQQRISRIGLSREDAKEQQDRAQKFESDAKDSYEKSKQNRKTAEKSLELAKANLDAAESKQEFEEANVKLARENASAAEQNLMLTMLNFEIEKAKAVQSSGLKSPAEIGLIQFETESYEAQKRLTETNLRSVELQTKVAKLSKELREKQKKVENLKF